MKFSEEKTTVTRNGYPNYLVDLLKPDGREHSGSGSYHIIMFGHLRDLKAQINFEVSGALLSKPSNISTDTSMGLDNTTLHIGGNEGINRFLAAIVILRPFGAF
jgi:hypothetical protein